MPILRRADTMAMIEDVIHGVTFFQNVGIGAEIQQLGIAVLLCALQFRIIVIANSNLIISIWAYFFLSGFSLIYAVKKHSTLINLAVGKKCPGCNKGTLLPYKYKCNVCGQEFGPSK